PRDAPGPRLLQKARGAVKPRDHCLMSVIRSELSTTSDAFRANAERTRALVSDLAGKATTIERGGPEEARKRHVARGKLLPRERLAQLLDFGSPFLEIGQFAAWDMYDD